MSVECSLEPQVGSLSDERLKQFLEEDEWYFSDSDSEESITFSEPEEDEEPALPNKVIYIEYHIIEYHIIATLNWLCFLQGPWADLCSNSTTLPTSPTSEGSRLSTTSEDLQSIIDFFLSQLGVYDPEVDDDIEDTDAGDKRSSDTIVLLEGEGSQQPTPENTLERKHKETLDTEVVADQSPSQVDVTTTEVGYL